MAGDEPPRVGVDTPPTSDDLSEAIGQLHAAEVTVHRRLLEVIATFDEQEKWREDLSPSMAAWLVARLSIASSTAGEWVRVARALERPPGDRRGGAEGRLSWDQLAPLTSFANETTDQVLAEAAPGWSAAETKALARRAKDPEGRRRQRGPPGEAAHLVAGRPPPPPARGAPDRGGCAADRAVLTSLASAAPKDPETDTLRALRGPGRRRPGRARRDESGRAVPTPTAPSSSSTPTRPPRPATRRAKPSSPKADGSPRRPHGASPVTAAGSWSSSTTTATWSASGAPPARSRPGSTDSSTSRDRGCRFSGLWGDEVAPRPPRHPLGRRRTRPIRTIWSCCAVATTGWSTKAAGRSPRRERARSPSRNRTATSSPAGHPRSDPTSADGSSGPTLLQLHHPLPLPPKPPT